MEHCETCEKFKFDFFGFKIESANPGIKSIVILIMLMLFLGGALFLFKQYLLPGVVLTGGGRNLMNFIASKIPILRKMNKASP